MGIILIKLPNATLADADCPKIIKAWNKIHPKDVVVIMPLESDVLIGQAARDELTRLRDEINTALERVK